MITIATKEKIYIVNEDFSVSPENKDIKDAIENALKTYTSPAQGFKTSFVADKLKNSGFNVVDVYDEEMENSPEGRVY